MEVGGPGSSGSRSGGRRPVRLHLPLLHERSVHLAICLMARVLDPVS